MRSNKLSTWLGGFLISVCAGCGAGVNPFLLDGDSESNADASTSGESDDSDSDTSTSDEPLDDLPDPDMLVPVCGNGVVEEGELCDDANTLDGDGCSSICDAANCLVPVSHTTITEALDDLTCATIYLMPLTYDENPLIERSVAIVGTGIGDRIINGGQLDSVVTLTDVAAIFDGVVIENGAAQFGGGIHAVDSELTLINTVIRENRATTTTQNTAAGGGIFVAGGSLTLLDSRVEDNTVILVDISSAEGLGGGIHGENTNIVLIGSEVTGNDIDISYSALGLPGGAQATARGGGVDAPSSTLRLSASSRVSDNSAVIDKLLHEAGGTAYVRGGGVYIDNAQFSCSSSEISANIARATNYTHANTYGGGLDVVSYDGVTIEHCSIDNNENASTSIVSSAQSQGGALRLYASPMTVTITDSSFLGNWASATSESNSGSAEGGAIYFYLSSGSPTVGITRTEFTDGSVESSNDAGGGALSFYTSGSANIDLEIDASSFTGNTIAADTLACGAAIKLRGASSSSIDMYAQNSTLSGNDCSISSGVCQGAALCLDDSTSNGALNVRTYLFNLTMTKNTADQGGALYINSPEINPYIYAALYNSIVYDNSADQGPDCYTNSMTAISLNQINLIGSLLACNHDQNGSPVVDDPLLAPLADNGGPTPTHALMASSAAIDATGQCQGYNNDLLTTDQRGEPRDDDACDLGAYEH